MSLVRHLVPFGRRGDFHLAPAQETANTGRRHAARREHQGLGAQILTYRLQGVFDRFAAITLQMHVSRGSLSKRPGYAPEPRCARAHPDAEAPVQTAARGVAGALESTTA